MRKFAQLLESKGKDLTYIKLHKGKSFFKELRKTINKKKINKLQVYEVEDSFFRNEIELFCLNENIEIEYITSPMFLTSRKEFKSFLTQYKKPLLNNFYINQRKKFNILIDKNNKPIGGTWSLDKENRNKIPKKFDLIQDDIKTINDPTTNEVKKVVDTFFHDHPGNSENYWIPNDRKHTIKWFKLFVEKKLKFFGSYQDAIDSRSDFLYHSVISPMMNIGFITPKEIIDYVLKNSNHIELNNLEGFIRQVLGWREFVRGIYHNYEEQMNNSNFWNHHRKLAHCWYDGTTEIKIIDDTIKKTLKYSYAHHIERLMILGNIMLLLEVDPKEVYKWFMQMYSDSSDWVMAANVYAMTQFNSGGIFATKPYICGSNYLIKMSHYKKGSWCDIIDGLYWKFVEKHQDFFKKNHRLSMMVKLLEKITLERKNHIYSMASKFQNKVTYL
jgi:deoxyribodipyrimidine photolyase-related protein